MTRSAYLVAALTLLVVVASARAGDAEAEITALIDAVGRSGCTFVRNGKQHEADEARSHLTMKYRRGKRHAGTAERFIDRLASKSSLSGRPYFMDCEGEARQEAGAWLHRQLAQLRAGNGASAHET